MARLRKILLLLLATIFLLAGCAYAFYWYSVSRYSVATDDAYVSGNSVEVMPEISGHVTAILADETDLVTKGEPIVNLDKADAYIALTHAEAQLALTVRQVNQYYKNVNQLKANVAVQQQSFQKAQEDLQRRKGLAVQQAISVEDLRHTQIAADSAAAALQLAQQQLAAAVALVANTDLYHHPQILQEANNVRNAYLTLQRTTIYAPETGYVAKRAVQVGQQVTPSSPLMIIVPLNQLWVNANFKEPQLRNIRIGQEAQLTSDIYGRSIKFKGTVVGLSPGTGSAFELLPPQNATGNWIKILQRLPVRIALDPKELTTHPLRLGLSMKAEIDTHNRNGAVLTTLPQKRVIYQTMDYSSQIEAVNQIIDKILQDNSENITLPAS